jgi:hypothetical protein
MALALALNQAWLWTLRAEMQADTDAAATAGAQTLVDDDLLRGDPAYLPALLQRSTDQALLYAGSNLVGGRPFALLANPANNPDGDIVFGTLPTPRSTTFIPAQNIGDTSNASLALINAVHVQARLFASRGNAPALLFSPFTGLASADIQAAATAMLDRAVIGFRPRNLPIPLAPIALLSDPTASDSRSWEYQVESKKGADQYRFDRAQGTFVFDAAGDGLFEFQAALALDPGQAAGANVALLHIGVQTIAGISGQLLNGVTAADLSDFGGQLVLPANDQLTVPGAVVGPPFGSPDLTKLQQSLVQLQQSAAVRIWPLACSVDATLGTVTVCRFVAARIVTVETPMANEPLRFTLQPTMLAVGAAVTDSSHVTNPYLCKVRVVQ